MSGRNEGAEAVSALDLRTFVSDYVRLAEDDLLTFPLDVSGAVVALGELLTATGRALPAHTSS